MTVRFIHRVELLTIFTIFHALWYFPQIIASVRSTVLMYPPGRIPIFLSTRFYTALYMIIHLLLAYLLLRWGFALLRRSVDSSNRTAVQTR